ncbi:Aminoglycoside phosphotransferase [Penicillium robsamsonii]|uniref:Aminoglycoside phosphotransferase n=1 Tax=Penicillium robsamsonii TaxID=1792511 RepID=UPI002546D759|nr:Aminoglycoside phosphotransferase [Penicillium robsamsonii]KAJ5826554.1 Aminoglycoside phosphotransferase [Penicillium robsamsonii]
MGRLSQSFSKRLRGIAVAIVSFSLSIVNHVTLKRLRGDGDSDDEDDELDSLDIDPFDAVLERVKVKHISRYVAAIRAKTQPGNKKSIPVVEVGSPDQHNSHLCYQVKFADGVSWLLKVPAIGTPDQFDEDDAENLRSEALTMMMLRRETTIPIPEVFAYNNTCENKLKVPFILMEFIDAVPLMDVWHDRESLKEVVQARRTRCLQDIAAAYVQLGKYIFNKRQLLRFDDQDRLIGVVPVNKDPFSGLREGYTSRLGRWKEQENAQGRAYLKLLRMFVDWIPKSRGEESFVLRHPGPNIFNFLVSGDGSVRAILNWDGAQAVPSSLGNETYPLWLMRDWCPPVYIWSEEMERGINDEDCVWEDSPDTLKFYRNVYAQCIANLLPESENAKVTRNSLLFQHLQMATGDPMFNAAITTKILGEVRKQAKYVDDNSRPFNPSDNKMDDNDNENHPSKEDATANHNSPNETEDNSEHGSIEADMDEDFYIDEMLLELERDGLSKHQLKLIKTGFQALFFG